MKTETLHLVDVYARLSRAVREAGGAQAWALQNGISASYVSDTLHARRAPGPLILEALGLVQIVTYAEKRKKPEESEVVSG
jgi:hypothetical protein